MNRRSSTLVLVVLLALGLVQHAAADETDQFTLPDRALFADLGPFMTQVNYRVLEQVLDDVNRRIRRVRQIRDPDLRARRLERLHAPDVLADGVRYRFGPGFFEMRHVEHVLRTQDAREVYGDKITAYRTPDWMYVLTHLPVDPRRIVLMFQSSTVQVYDVFLGVDKFGHFHDLGHIYYTVYLAMRRRDADHDEAVARTVEHFSRGFISENMLIGNFATGVFSNADLASNYAGMVFYMNLTEPVVIDGVEHPPLFIRKGDLWWLNFHVRPDSDFMRPFFTDHWNEALNPNVYEWGMRWAILNHLDRHRERILAFYSDEEGNPRPREYFDERARELSTWFGADYGHSGFVPGLIGIAEGCFPEEEAAEEEGREPGP